MDFALRKLSPIYGMGTAPQDITPPPQSLTSAAVVVRDAKNRFAPVRLVGFSLFVMLPWTTSFISQSVG